MSTYDFTPFGWSAPTSTSGFQTEASSSSAIFGNNDSYFADFASSSSPSAGSSSGSSSSAPVTPPKSASDAMLSSFESGPPSTAGPSLGSGWVSVTPFLPASASVAERTNDSGFFLTLSSEVDKKLRTVQACDACRTRKAKCDGAKDSCTRCIQRGICCAYTTGPRIKAAKRPSLASSTASSSSSAVPLASHVKLQSVTTPAKARKAYKLARRSSTESVAEPYIVDGSAYADEGEFSGELAYGWSAQGLAAPFELASYGQPAYQAPVQHTQYYPTAAALVSRRTSLPHQASSYATPYARPRTSSLYNSPSVLAPARGPSSLGQPRRASSFHPSVGYSTPMVVEDSFAACHSMPAAIRRVSAPAAPSAAYSPAASYAPPPTQESSFDPFEVESMWDESQPLWGEAAY